MIEDKEVKIAESPEEALILRTLENTEKRIVEEKLVLELDEVVLQYLKKKAKK